MVVVKFARNRPANCWPLMRRLNVARWQLRAKQSSLPPAAA